MYKLSTSATYINGIDLRYILSRWSHSTLVSPKMDATIKILLLEVTFIRTDGYYYICNMHSCVLTKFVIEFEIKRP